MRLLELLGRVGRNLGSQSAVLKSIGGAKGDLQ